MSVPLKIAAGFGAVGVGDLPITLEDLVVQELHRSDGLRQPTDALWLVSKS